MKLISGYIRNQIASKLGPHVLDATLIKITTGTRTPGAQAAGTNPTSTSYPCKGWASSFEARQIDGVMIKSTDVEISLLGGTLPDGVMPEVNDKITIEFPPDSGVSETYRIVGGGKDGKGVRPDPVAAKYTCHARK